MACSGVHSEEILEALIIFSKSSSFKRNIDDGLKAFLR